MKRLWITPTPPPSGEVRAEPWPLKAKFGDVIENGWASLENPTRRGFFVREGRRTGRMNPGRYFEVTDGKGKFWELSPRGDHKITVTPAQPQAITPASEVRSDDLPSTYEGLVEALTRRAEMYDAPRNPELYRQAAAAIRSLEGEAAEMKAAWARADQSSGDNINKAVEWMERAEAATARAARMEEALRKIGRQPRSTELDGIEAAGADFEDGYDKLIEIARTALRGGGG